MPTITSTTRTEAIGVTDGPYLIRLKGTWGGGSITIYHATPRPTDVEEADWFVLDDLDGPTAITEDKTYTDILPAGSISFKASSAPTSVVAEVVKINSY